MDSSDPTHFRNLGPSFDPAAARASRDVGPDARYRSGSLQCTNYCAYLIGDPVYYKWNELLSRWWGASAPHPLLDDRTPAAGYLPGVMVNGQMWPSDIAAGVGGEYIEVLAPGSTTSVSYPDSHWFARPIANDGGTALSCYNGFCN